MASSVASSSYSIASLIASDPVKAEENSLNSPKQRKTSAEVEVENSSGSVAIKNEGKAEQTSTSRCSCFACSQPSAFSPFKTTFGTGVEANPFSSFPTLRSLADYVYIPTKGQ